MRGSLLHNEFLSGGRLTFSGSDRFTDESALEMRLVFGDAPPAAPEPAAAETPAGDKAPTPEELRLRTFDEKLTELKGTESEKKPAWTTAAGKIQALEPADMKKELPKEASALVDQLVESPEFGDTPPSRQEAWDLLFGDALKSVVKNLFGKKATEEYELGSKLTVGKVEIGSGDKISQITAHHEANPDLAIVYSPSSKTKRLGECLAHVADEGLKKLAAYKINGEPGLGEINADNFDLKVGVDLSKVKGEQFDALTQLGITVNLDRQTSGKYVITGELKDKQSDASLNTVLQGTVARVLQGVDSPAQLAAELGNLKSLCVAHVEKHYTDELNDNLDGTKITPAQYDKLLADMQNGEIEKDEVLGAPFVLVLDSGRHLQITLGEYPAPTMDDREKVEIGAQVKFADEGQLVTVNLTNRAGSTYEISGEDGSAITMKSEDGSFSISGKTTSNEDFDFDLTASQEKKDGEKHKMNPLAALGAKLGKLFPGTEESDGTETAKEDGKDGEKKEGLKGIGKEIGGMFGQLQEFISELIKMLKEAGVLDIMDTFSKEPTKPKQRLTNFILEQNLGMRNHSKLHTMTFDQVIALKGTSDKEGERTADKLKAAGFQTENNKLAVMVEKVHSMTEGGTAVDAKTGGLTFMDAMKKMGYVNERGWSTPAYDGDAAPSATPEPAGTPEVDPGDSVDGADTEKTSVVEHAEAASTYKFTPEDLDVHALVMQNEGIPIMLGDAVPGKIIPKDPAAFRIFIGKPLSEINQNKTVTELATEAGMEVEQFQLFANQLLLDSSRDNDYPAPGDKLNFTQEDALGTSFDSLKGVTVAALLYAQGVPPLLNITLARKTPEATMERRAKFLQSITQDQGNMKNIIHDDIPSNRILLVERMQDAGAFNRDDIATFFGDTAGQGGDELRALFTNAMDDDKIDFYFGEDIDPATAWQKDKPAVATVAVAEGDGDDSGGDAEPEDDGSGDVETDVAGVMEFSEALRSGAATSHRVIDRESGLAFGLLAVNDDDTVAPASNAKWAYPGAAQGHAHYYDVVQVADGYEWANPDAPDNFDVRKAT